MNWLRIKNKSIDIKNHSTACLVELTITKEEEVEQGSWEKVSETVWFDYEVLDDLKQILKELDD